jgi:DHA1 family multidrug resistance protein-like MFS transporter
MFAPTMAGLLAEAVGMRWVFFLTTVFYFITMISLTQISSQHPKNTKLPVEETQAAGEVAPFRRWRIVFLSTLFASVMFLLSLVFPLVPQFLSDVYHIDIVHIGILGSFTYLGGSTLSLIMGRIGDKHGETTSIAIAMILVAIALTIFISIDNFASLIFASFLRGASFPMWAFIGATVGPLAPIASRARWISVVQTITQVASILAPYVGGILYASSPQTPFLLTIVASAVLALIAHTAPCKEQAA